MRTAIALISCVIVIFILLSTEKQTSQNANATGTATKDVSSRRSWLNNETMRSHTAESPSPSGNGRRKPSMDQDTSSDIRSRSFTTTRTPTTSASLLSQPFQIFQLGDPRSASTFQFELLCSIVTWKMLPITSKEIPCRFIKRTQMRGNRFQRRLREKVANNETFVFKAHNDPGVIRELVKSTHLVVFSSGGVGSSFAIYTQQYNRLQRCPECEVDQYQPLFQLSDTEVSQIKEHMKIFGIIRQCCGLQMSQYEMQRLHGCDMTKYLDRSSYPNCEQHSADEMRAMEDAFAASPIPFRVSSPEYNWAKPGDCARFRGEIVVNGKGFNGKVFLGCEDIP
ncbi:unnamed protein product [Cylindrotheca closterium]|uniref:Deacetylase sirtuin-type domain-containing protein n=1 Tax=Cylindrotheca closterium TaxID=2856 RepID=A0AAD2FLI5_9STRA|nr:unnamed protein product [Cylindrotheca closterium]